MRTSKAG